MPLTLESTRKVRRGNKPILAHIGKLVKPDIDVVLGGFESPNFGISRLKTAPRMLFTNFPI
jgi:hypothetical protein